MGVDDARDARAGAPPGKRRAEDAWPDERIDERVGAVRPGHPAGDPASRAVRNNRARHRRRAHTPALIVWGERDPWYPPALADAYAAHLPRRELERLSDAGHWPWLDRGDLVERVATFLEE